MFSPPMGPFAPRGVLYDRYLMRVKTPAESKYPWEYLTVVAKIPGAYSDSC
jgi:branched-chain amino acid transport system substrate-binding protein